MLLVWENGSPKIPDLIRERQGAGACRCELLTRPRLEPSPMPACDDPDRLFIDGEFVDAVGRRHDRGAQPARQFS